MDKDLKQYLYEIKGISTDDRRTLSFKQWQNSFTGSNYSGIFIVNS